MRAARQALGGSRGSERRHFPMRRLIRSWLGPLLGVVWAQALAAPSAVGLIAAADPEAGRVVASSCAACHSFQSGAAHGTGPNLWGVVGAARGAKADFDYSPALAAAGGVWDYQNLDRFLANPQAAIPGTRMPFAGLADAEARAQVIAFLRTLADDPLPLPAGSQTGAAPTAGGDDLGGLAEGEGRELVYYACSSCHSINLVKQQRLSRKRWEKTLEWMVAEQGMNELPPGENEVVLDYLAAHYGSP